MRKWPLIFSVCLLGIAGLLVARLFVQAAFDRNSCAHDDQRIAQNSHGDSIWATEEVCDDVFVHSDVITLALKNKGGTSEKFFSYAPSYVPDIAKPAISWTASNGLTVDIARVGEVYTKRERVDGLNIRYKIDHVEVANDHA